VHIVSSVGKSLLTTQNILEESMKSDWSIARSVLALVLIAGCNNDQKEPDIPKSFSASEAIFDDFDVYAHPMKEAVYQDKVILQDIKGPNERERFVVGDIITATSGQTPQIFSGVAINQIATASPDDVQTDATPFQKRERLHNELSDWIQKAPVTEKREINLTINRPADYVPSYDRFERAIALGKVNSQTDAKNIRAELANEQQAIVEREQNILIAEITGVGGTILGKCLNSFCLSVEVTPPQLKKLNANDRIHFIDPVTKIQNNVIGGLEVLAGAQISQYVDANFDGYVSPNRIDAAILEHTSFNTTHPGFKNSTSGSRIGVKRKCTGGSCSAVASFGTAQAHATATSGLLAGDLMDGQDATITTTDARSDRSGYGREATVNMWQAPYDSDIDEALADISNFGYPVLSMSISATGDTTCLGSGVLSEEVNDLFDAGTVTFFASGNNGHVSTTNCVVEEPGSAVGAFVVGAHVNSASTDGEIDVRSGSIATYSDRGGTSSEGQRTIIDLTAAGCRQNLFSTSGGYGSTACGTSYSAPTVAGSAIDFIDFYKSTFGNGIDDPTSLTANMLLMGDRQGESGFLNIGFSNLWGAGRQKMRKFDSAGMDNPFQYGSLTTCIDHQTGIYQPLNNGNRISSDVDVLKAVVFFFDRRHEDGVMDDINLFLERSSDNVTWTKVRSSVSAVDEKERVFHADFSGNYYWRLKVFGYSVTADQTACGTNSMKVRYAWFFEDSDREVAEDLDDIDTED